MPATFDTSCTFFDFAQLRRDHVATQCVCCGSEHLQSSPAILMPFLAHRIFGWTPVTIDESWGLRTIQSGHAYSICKSLYCTECGFLFLDLRFSSSELANLYDNYRGEDYTNLRELYEPGYKLKNGKLQDGIEYIAEIEQFLKPFLSTPIRVLDWGGDTGQNTPFQKQAECLDIYDISGRPVIEDARRVSREEIATRDYSLIVCSNVLEHVPYPSDLLFDMAKVMREDSILYIEIPLEELMRNHVDQLPSRKKHWHEHINFYSKKSMTRLVENAGLEVVAVKTLQTEVAGTPASLLQLVCRRRKEGGAA
jgi:hypothetical protein